MLDAQFDEVTKSFVYVAGLFTLGGLATLAKSVLDAFVKHRLFRRENGQGPGEGYRRRDDHLMQRSMGIMEQQGKLLERVADAQERMTTLMEKSEERQIKMAFELDQLHQQTFGPRAANGD